MEIVFKFYCLSLLKQSGFQTLELFAMVTSCISIVAIILLFFPLDSTAHNTKWTRINGMRWDLLLESWSIDKVANNKLNETNPFVNYFFLLTDGVGTTTIRSTSTPDFPTCTESQSQQLRKDGTSFGTRFHSGREELFIQNILGSILGGRSAYTSAARWVPLRLHRQTQRHHDLG